MEPRRVSRGSRPPKRPTPPGRSRSHGVGGGTTVSSNSGPAVDDLGRGAVRPARDPDIHRGHLRLQHALHLGKRSLYGSQAVTVRSGTGQLVVIDVPAQTTGGDADLRSGNRSLQHDLHLRDGHPHRGRGRRHGLVQHRAAGRHLRRPLRRFSRRRRRSWQGREPPDHVHGRARSTLLRVGRRGIDRSAQRRETEVISSRCTPRPVQTAGQILRWEFRPEAIPPAIRTVNTGSRLVIVGSTASRPPRGRRRARPPSPSRCHPDGSDQGCSSAGVSTGGNTAGNTQVNTGSRLVIRGLQRD